MEDHDGPATAHPAPAHTGPPAAAYPYATAAGPPPPPPPPPPYYNYPPHPYYNPQQIYYQPQPDYARRASCLRCMFTFVIGLFFIFLMTTFIMWLVFRPQLPEFQVDSFSLSNITFTNGSSRAFLIADIQLTARNPNGKLSLSYDHVAAGVYYKFELLSKTAISPFSTGTKSERAVVAKLAGDGDFVDKWVVDGINEEIGKNANVGFDLKLHSWINFESNSWRSRNTLTVFCGDLAVGIPDNGSTGRLTGGPRPCRVGT